MLPSAFTWCVVSKVGKPKEELTSRLSHELICCCGLMVGKTVAANRLPSLHTHKVGR